MYVTHDTVPHWTVSAQIVWYYVEEAALCLYSSLAVAPEYLQQRKMYSYFQGNSAATSNELQLYSNSATCGV